MKLYEKIIDGKQHVKPRNKIVLHRTQVIKDSEGNEKEVKMQTFNPTEEMLLEDGWVEHIPVPYEPTEEEILNREKEYKIEEILRHDSSPEVNAFYISDQEMWLDKATRAGLMLRLQAEQTMGKEMTTLWYGANQYSLPIGIAMQMLLAIEIYASECYDNTQRHLAEVDKLETKEEIESYDYRSGYPQPLEF